MVTIPAGQPAHLTIPVTVRASGAFPMQVTITSPDHGLPIAHTRLRRALDRHLGDRPDPDRGRRAVPGPVVGPHTPATPGAVAAWWARATRCCGPDPPADTVRPLRSPTPCRPGGAMPGVRIVTDSSCDLSQQEAADLGVAVVPLTIRFGDEEFVDLEELSVADFYRRMAESSDAARDRGPGARAASSRPSAAWPTRAPTRSCASTCRPSCRPPSSRPATRPGPWPTRSTVRVIDSRTLTAGLGTIVLEAAKAAARRRVGRRHRGPGGRPDRRAPGCSPRSTPWTTSRRAGASARPSTWWARCCRSSRSST